MDIEQMGISVKPKCGNCKCGECIVEGKECSLQELRETKMIEDGLTFNKERKKWTIKYPWIKSPTNLPNNYVAAYARLKSTERRLSKLGTEYAKKYSEQVYDMVERKVAAPITQWEKLH